MASKASWKNVRNLGFVSFFTDLSSEMIFGVLPIFIIDELGAGKAFLGVIEGLGESVGYGSRTVSGSISDFFGRRKPIVFAGYFLSAITKPLFAIAVTPIHALTVRVGDRVGKGIRTSPRDALLSDSVNDVHLGKAFGLHKSMDQAGAVIGPLIAFGLLFFVDIRDLFWFSLIPAAVALVILLFLVKEKRVTPTRHGIYSNFRQVLRGRFLVFVGIVTLFSVGAFNFSFVLVESAELGVAIAFVPLVYVIINVAHTAAGFPAGMLSDRIGAEKVLLIGFGLFLFVALLGFSEIKLVEVGLVMAVLFGLYHGITLTSQRAIVSKYTASEVRATAFGAYYLFLGISFLVANVVFGTLWDLYGSQIAFAYSTITSILGVIALGSFILIKRR